MKSYTIITTVILMISIILPARAQKKDGNSITWYTLEQAMEMNKKGKNKKKIFIDIYTNWCGWCKKMEAETFRDGEVSYYMNKYFIAVKFNAEGGDTINFKGNKYVNPSPSTPRSTHQLANTLMQGQLSYPSFIFMKADGSSITMVKGYKGPADFVPVLIYYGDDIYLNKSWPEYQKEYNEKNGSIPKK